MKESKCPFLEVTRVAYCKAFPVKKMIPVEKISSARGPCNSPHFQDCSLFKEISVPGRESVTIRGVLMKSDYYFHPRHLWVRISEDRENEVIVGIDDFAQKIIGTVVDISHPPKHTEIREDGACCTLSGERGTVRVGAPVTGTIRDVNPELEYSPSLINSDPYGEGWILNVQLTGDGLKGLFYGSSAEKWLKWETERLFRTFAEDLGVTATNGGITIGDIGCQLGESRWRHLIGQFLG